MSGYLQRLALGAFEPRRAIQPLSRPLFLPSQSPLEPEPPPMDPAARPDTSRAFRAPAPAPRAPAPARQASAPVPPHLPGDEDTGLHTVRPPESRPADEFANQIPVSSLIRSFTPLLPSRQSEKATPIGEPLPAEEGRPRQVTGPPVEDRHMDPTAMPERSADVEQSEPPPAERAERKVSPDKFSSRPFKPGGDRRARTSPRHADRGGEADEIEIHIGRIEVIAAPPAPARPAPPAGRHGAPSLDDYLRRRDGKPL